MQESFLMFKPGKITKLPSMPQTLSNFGATIGGGYLHVLGGLAGNTTYSRNYHFMNLSTLQWTTASNVLSTNYYYHDMFYINRGGTGPVLHAQSGFNPSITYASFQGTPATTGAWTSYNTGDTGAGMRTEKRMVLMPDNDTLYELGGYDGTNAIAGMTKYLFSTSVFSNVAPLPKPLDGHFAGSYNGKLYVFSGWSQVDGNQTAIQQYDPTTNTWTQIATCPVASSWVGGCIYKNLIVYGYAPNGTGGTTGLVIYNIDTGKFKIKDTKLPCSIGCEIVPDPTVNKGVLLLGGTVNNYVGGPNYAASARYSDVHLIDENWLRH